MEIVKVNASDYGIEPKQENELIGNLPQIKKERDVLAEQYSTVIGLDIEDPKTSVTAKELRLKIRDNRTKNLMVWHTTTKAVFLRAGQFIDALKNKEIAVNEQMEKNLEKIEKHFENLEKQRILILQNKRIELIKPFVEDTQRLDLGNMDEDVFEAFKIAKENSYNKKIEEEEKAEKEKKRLKQEAETAIEAQRIENEKLKAKVAIKDKRHNELKAYINFIRNYDEMISMNTTDYTKEFENIKKIAELKWENDRKEQIQKDDEKQKQDTILAKTQAKLKAKIEQENKEKTQRLELEFKTKKEAEKLAKAPIKKQLTAWVNKFDIPSTILTDEKTMEISKKFQSFKMWAINEVENM